jgi:hypothetical protein
MTLADRYDVPVVTPGRTRGHRRPRAAGSARARRRPRQPWRHRHRARHHDPRVGARRHGRRHAAPSATRSPTPRRRCDRGGVRPRGLIVEPDVSEVFTIELVDEVVQDDGDTTTRSKRRCRTTATRSSSLSSTRTARNVVAACRFRSGIHRRRTVITSGKAPGRVGLPLTRGRGRLDIPGGSTRGGSGL